MTDLSKNEELAQLHWACRRGMLELDLMLRQFVDSQYLGLSNEEKALFKELLVCVDQDLFAWLLGSRQPADTRFVPLLKKIQMYAPAANSPKAL